MTTKKSVYKMKTINGDALTPITIYKKLIGKDKFLLESSFQHKIKGKYSYIGLNPYEEIIGIKNKTIIRNLGNGTETTFDMDALNYIKNISLKLIHRFLYLFQVERLVLLDMTRTDNMQTLVKNNKMKSKFLIFT